MRWDNLLDGQTSDERAKLPLFAEEAFVRRFKTPEFRGMTFYEVRAKSIVNHVPGDRFGFNWTINPYRGCQHACVYCLEGDTPILMADGRTRPLREVRAGDEIYGTAEEGHCRRCVITTVLARWSSIKPAYRVTLEDGTEIVASGDHQFLTERGWKHVTSGESGRPHLTTSNSLMGIGRSALARKEIQAAVGARHDVQAIRTSALGSVRAIEDISRWRAERSSEWTKGYGILDAEGSFSGGTLRIANSDPEIIEATCRSLRLLGCNPSLDVGGRSRPHPSTYIRHLGGMREHFRFFHTVNPAISRKTSWEDRAINNNAALQVKSIESLGIEVPMFDITTGTGDFIANGVVAHNCFARPTHTYLDFDAGRDFETRIVVKVNAPELLQRELRRASWKGEHIAMGTNTDPYQRAEGHYRLMRGILGELNRARNPYSILTKGTLIQRDIDLLAEGIAVTDVHANLSVGTVDEKVWRETEPGTPHPLKRLEIVRRLNEAGIPCGVLMAPILPGISDSMDQLEATVKAAAEAGATHITPLTLHLRPGVKEEFLPWLEDRYPQLSDAYASMYRRSNAPKEVRENIAAAVGNYRRKHRGHDDDPGSNPRRVTERSPPPPSEGGHQTGRQLALDLTTQGQDSGRAQRRPVPAWVRRRLTA
ncbi:MAG: intein-containing Rv2578c family radical SAM protein [Actinomycetota bacterium]